LQGAASLGSSNPDVPFYLARAYMAKEQYGQAAQTLETLIADNENYLEAYYFLGETYGKMNQMPDAHFYLGLYHFKRGDLRTAYFHLDRAKKLLQDPSKLETVNRTLNAIGKLPPEEQKQ